MRRHANGVKYDITQTLRSLVEESEHLATSVLPPRLFVVHDSVGGREHNVTELPRGQQVGNPFLHIAGSNVEAGADDTALVDASVELHNNLASPVVVDNLKFSDVSVLLHALEELDDHLGAGADEHLALAALFGVAHSLERIGENRHAHHLDE